MKTFKPDNKAERQMLKRINDSMRQLQKHLQPFFNDALNLFELPANKKRELRAALIKDVPIAATRFFANGGLKKSYSFATYFSWYIGERINKIPGLKRKKPRIDKHPKN